MTSDVSCFKSYDIRGEIGINFNEKICFNIGQAFSQTLCARNVVVGFDARATSSMYASKLINGLTQSGSNVLEIGLCGTEEMYSATQEFDACGGIQVTASHNPINFNGLKLVKKMAAPLDPNGEFLALKKMVKNGVKDRKIKPGKVINKIQEAKKSYIKKILSFVSLKKINDLKVLVNCGNGAAGPTFRIIEQKLKGHVRNLEFIKIFDNPDPTFPNGIPNPLLKKNHKQTRDKLLACGADFGVAFDGDFDRCFFFDEDGEFIDGEYIIGLLVEFFLENRKRSKIVHDSRVVWNIEDIIRRHGGTSTISKTGHAFMKRTMKETNAVYGGELSSHHYFKKFGFCDSGMIPFLLILEFVSKKNMSLGSLVKERKKKYPSSGEINFKISDPQLIMEKIRKFYEKDNVSINHADGLSMSFDGWRFNLRVSNTESLLRLNVESKGDKVLLKIKEKQIAKLIKQYSV